MGALTRDEPNRRKPALRDQCRAGNGFAFRNDAPSALMISA